MNPVVVKIHEWATERFGWQLDAIRRIYENGGLTDEDVDELELICLKANGILFPEGDGFTDIIFSNRSNMSYEDIREYLRLLLKQQEANPMTVQVDPSVIDPERIETIEHSKRSGLQVADGVASGVHFAVKRNRYGEVEPAYLSHLNHTLYRHDGNVLGYGLKLWPGDIATIKEKAPEVEHLEGL
jgi:hypothetical protein